MMTSRLAATRNTATAIVAMFALTVTAADNPSTAYIQRTMQALKASTAEKPAQVRVLFYGQSITAQAWTKTVQKQLEERYPTVQFEFLNAAIGGYDSTRLIRTADHDLYPWYPDLLFFHVYGPLDKYEEIVKRVRQRTSAEIVIWTSHFSRDEAKKQAAGEDVVYDERAEGIRAVAKKYNCMLVDLRRKWYDYLANNKIAGESLLTDAVHLNEKGCDLYAKCIGEELHCVPELGENPASSGTILTIPVTDPAVTRGKDGSLALRFSGNRVLAVSDGTGGKNVKASVLLDGQPMDDRPELWAITRPSLGPAGIWMPAINHIAFQLAPLAEDWTLTCLPDSTPDGKKIHFDLRGSATGYDGDGWSTTPFVSRSRRVMIEPDDWRVAWTLGYMKAILPEAFGVTWRSYPLFTRVYGPQPAGTRTRLVQGCRNAEHTLTLLPEPAGGNVGIGAFVVCTPPPAP
jgi:hypothetical protein